MKKEVIKFLIKFFTLFLFISSFLLYNEIRLRAVPNTYTVKKKYFEKNLDSIQVLVLGSSHAMCGIDPEQFSLKAFDLANVSQSLYYDKNLCLKYIDKMPRLKYVLISISYFSLWYQLHSSPEDFREYFYYHFWDIPNYSPKFFDLKQVSYISLYGTDFSQNAFKKNFKVAQVEENLTASGWLKRIGVLSIPGIDSSAQTNIERHTSFMQDNFLKDNIQNIDTMLNVISKKGIVPVLFTTPVSKAYSSKTNASRDSIMNDIIREFCVKYHCKYFNYSTDPRFELNDFFDSDHLNTKGAEKLSRIINDEILSKSNN